MRYLVGGEVVVDSLEEACEVAATAHKQKGWILAIEEYYGS